MKKTGAENFDLDRKSRMSYFLGEEGLSAALGGQQGQCPRKCLLIWPGACVIITPTAELVPVGGPRFFLPTHSLFPCALPSGTTPSRLAGSPESVNDPLPPGI